jgi:hypothetical protein
MSLSFVPLAIGKPYTSLMPSYRHIGESLREAVAPAAD